MQKTMGAFLLVAVILSSAVFLLRASTLETKANAQQRVFTFHNIDFSKPLLLDFPDYRVRVDGWDRDYVEIQVDGRTRQPLSVKVVGNGFLLHAEEFRPPLWEPAVRVKAPFSANVHVRGTEIWANECVIAHIDARRVYVRDAILPTNLQSKLPSYADTRDWQTISI